MSTAHAIPRLGAVLKLERVAPLTAEALADLWHSRAALKPNTVAAVSSADALRLIHSRLQLCPNVSPSTLMLTLMPTMPL